MGVKVNVANKRKEISKTVFASTGLCRVWRQFCVFSESVLTEGICYHSPQEYSPKYFPSFLFCETIGYRLDIGPGTKGTVSMSLVFTKNCNHCF